MLLISEEQFFLNRLANSAIDIYSMVCLLSRATRSLERGYTSSQHEAMMTQVFCEEVTVLHSSISTVLTVNCEYLQTFLSDVSIFWPLLFPHTSGLKQNRCKSGSIDIYSSKVKFRENEFHIKEHGRSWRSCAETSTRVLNRFFMSRQYIFAGIKVFIMKLISCSHRVEWIMATFQIEIGTNICMPKSLLGRIIVRYYFTYRIFIATEPAKLHISVFTNS